MSISRQSLEIAVQQINPTWKLHGVHPISRRASTLEISNDLKQRKRLILLSHSDGDRERNPQIARDEYRLLHLLHNAGLPVAQPMHLDETHHPPFFIASYIAGSTRHSTADLPGFCGKLADTLTAIHAVDLCRHEFSFLPLQEETILQRLQSVDAKEDQAVTLMRSAMRQIKMNPPTLLHGDFWPGNLIWEDDCVSGIIDWEDAMLGDPLGDLSKSRLEILWALETEAMTVYTEHYLARNPKLDATCLPFWDLWGALRLGHFASFATDADRIPMMRAEYDCFVAGAIRGLDALQK